MDGGGRSPRLNRGCFFMFGTFLSFIAGHMLYFWLHLESSSFPRPLSSKEEAECLAALGRGDMEARDRLIRHNLRLVAHVVKKYYPGSADTDDLISIGTIGLIKAVASFDSTKKARFSTYAAKCIENEILMYFRSDKKNRGTLYINEPLEADGGEGALTLNDVLADSFFVDEDYEQKADAERLRSYVDTILDGRERQIVRLRYGFAGGDPLSQQQVADILGISRSYVSRLEKKAVEQLKTAMERE